MPYSINRYWDKYGVWVPKYFDHLKYGRPCLGLGERSDQLLKVTSERSEPAGEIKATKLILGITFPKRHIRQVTKA